jgi:polyphosphate kinase 2 (PPK2 family)
MAKKKKGKKQKEEDSSRIVPVGKRQNGGATTADEKGKLTRKAYEKELLRLQVELVRLQEWVKVEQKKVLIIFEGRDTAGKGGVIKRITERVSPRVFRVVALPTPTEREKTQMYYQRCIAHLLSVIPYKKIPFEKPQLPKPLKKPEGVPDTPMYRQIVPHSY